MNPSEKEASSQCQHLFLRLLIFSSMCFSEIEFQGILGGGKRKKLKVVSKHPYKREK